MGQEIIYKLNCDVPLCESADVVVIGGGPAGTAAAISASRCGRKVVLLEHSGQLGGMGTLGNVSIFMPVGNVTGIYRELISDLLTEYLPGRHDESIAPQFSPFQLRHYWNQKLHKEKVSVYFHSSFVGVVKENERVKAVIVNTRSGLRAFEGSVFIDCTGDARVAGDAGVARTSGRTSDGMTQPMTMMFMMQNTGKPVNPYLPEGCYEYKDVSDLPQGRLLHWEYNTDGTLLVNMTRVKGNGADIRDVNYAEVEGLKQVFSVANYLQRNGFGTYILSHVPGQIGVRETNQIQGRYTLTEHDVMEGKRFSDVAAQTNYEIDIHSPDGKKTTDERKVAGYDIPYRCMVPIGCEGLLVAGRSISATHVAMSSMRVQPTCYALGQSAGVAASIAYETGCSVADIPMTALHDQLRKQDVMFV
jgi:hypothetical protein